MYRFLKMTVMAPEKKEGTAGGPSFGLVISIVLLPILLI